MKLWLIASGTLLSLVFLAGCKLTRAGYESAGYKVVRRSGSFEIRDYPPFTPVFLRRNEVMVRVKEDAVER